MISNFLQDNEALIRLIMSDIQGMTKYIHIGVGIALVYGVLYLIYVIFCKITKRERKLSAWHAISVFALLIYLTAILFIVFMSREAGQYDGVNLHLWSSWGITTRRKALFIENIIMFIPMGILLPSAFKTFRNPFVCIFSCAVMSCFIEQTQFIFKLGFAELDDVVTNTLGGAIGWIIWGILWFICLIIHGIFHKNK
ncbi:VanZ family protein [Butyrivibrio sp. FC2001]|uniref:VanZ family protein n=1 Tax=Butyrivibrio sp. FC2001 TaxID=1280671 RepID=UPI000415697F|nr:VanZ family protein [Butyrivibrio sp. FC2001]